MNIANNYARTYDNINANLLTISQNNCLQNKPKCDSKMSKRKRTSVEDALDIVIQHLHENTPVTIGELASEIGFSWVVIDRAIDITMMIQDYFRAHKIEVLGGKGKKIIIGGSITAITQADARYMPSISTPLSHHGRRMISARLCKAG